ncbi:MAG: UbiD family decarboxylase [Peptococcaceae bacterium]|nr:UbiD family decarboxylase [Candidatus Syntrophopropionicum ammoniitolerans]
MFRDLREFLAKLEENGQLVRIKDSIYPEPTIREICRAAVDVPNGPAVIMNNIKGMKGMQIAMNVHGSWANIALMMGLDKDTPVKDQFFNFLEAWDRYPGEIKNIDSDKAPCHEVIVKDNINLFEHIPLFRINKWDAACFFSKSCIVSKDPYDKDNFDTQNVGTYRLQIIGKDQICIQALAFHDIARHVTHAEEQNEPLPVAIALGNDPVLTFMASTPINYDQSEYKYAAAINGIPMEITKALNSDLDVPANAEFVIEGEILPRVRVPEGPFGEFPGSYSGMRLQSVIQVKSISYRKNPIFENLFMGRPWTEIDYLMGLNTSAPLYNQLKESMPEVHAVNAMYQHGLTTIISTKNRFGGYAKSVAFRLSSTPHGISYCKNIILVDEDVDPFNLEQVMWSLSCRVRAEKDVLVIQNTPGMPLDPTSYPAGMGNKFIIDATEPTDPDGLLRDTRLIESPDSKDFEKVIADLQKAAQKA